MHHQVNSKGRPVLCPRYWGKNAILTNTSLLKISSNPIVVCLPDSLEVSKDISLKVVSTD